MHLKDTGVFVNPLLMVKTLPRRRFAVAIGWFTPYASFLAFECYLLCFNGIIFPRIQSEVCYLYFILSSVFLPSATLLPFLHGEKVELI